MSLKDTMGNWKFNTSLGSRAVCIGLTLGWPESSLSYYLLTHCDNICYNFSSNGLATVQVVMNFGSCLGALVPTWIADKYGRRAAFAVAGFSNFTFWVVLLSFEGYVEIIFAAVVGGFAAGIFFTTSALYVNEISTPRSRGATGAITALSAYGGVLFGTFMIFVAYTRFLALIMACIAMMYLISVRVWMVESPYFFFIKGQTLDTKLSLKALRGVSSVLDVDSEYKTIELSLNENSSPKSGECGACKILSSSRRAKYEMFMIILLFITQMIGAYGMDDFSKKFFNTILPKYGKIVIAFLDLFSVVICLIIIEKYARRPLLLMISIVGSSVSCLILAIWMFTGRKPVNVEYLTLEALLLPVIIIAFYYTIYSLGLTPVMPILTAEMFPSRDRTMYLGFCISFIYFSSIIVQSVFEFLNKNHDSNLAFGTFAIIGALGIPIVFSLVPGIAGKPLREIQNDFEDFTVLTF